KIVLSALTATVLLVLGVAGVSADEAVVLVCTPTLGLGVPTPPVFVTTCDRSAGVPVACPPPLFGLEGAQAASCAQTLAAFLSLPGYKLANVQPMGNAVLYTIDGPSRNQR